MRGCSEGRWGKLELRQERSAKLKKYCRTISPEIKLWSDRIQKDLDWTPKPFNSLNYTHRKKQPISCLIV